MPTAREQQAAGKTPLDPGRVKLIEAARTGWISRLIDLTRRNNLLYYRAIPTSSIEVPASSPALLELLAGKMVTTQALLPELEDRPTRILSIERKARENSEEKGLQTLYLAIGFATWNASDGGRNPKAPVFLLPVTMKKKGRELTALEVQVAGEVRVNPVLLHVLSDEFNIKVTEEELLDSVTPKDAEGPAAAKEQMGASNLACYTEAVSALAGRFAKVPAFATDFATVISNFSFAKLALVNDLKAAGELLNSNDVVAAIAGDTQARGRLGSAQIDVNPRSLDAKPADQEFCVVEADSSQQCAIAGIAAGQNAVIHGPPGTGKSQTITNLIATLVANGKTVLFVAEKRAALEVVQQRLERSGLDHLAMDLHGAELSPKKVMERVTRTLNLVRSSRPVEAETTHRQFQDRRSKLNSHDSLMHTVSERTGKSVFELQGAILRLLPAASTSVRWRGAELAQITPVKAERVRDLLGEAAPFGKLFLRDDPSPWTGIPFKSGQEVQSALDTSQRLFHEYIPSLSSLLAELEHNTGFCAPSSFAELDSLLVVLKNASTWLGRYNEAVFAADLPNLILQLSRAKDGGLTAIWLSLTDASVKAAKKRVVELRKGTSVSLPQAWKELNELQSLKQKWAELSRGASVPFIYPGLESLEKAAATVGSESHNLQKIVGKSGWEQLNFESLSRQVEPFAADSSTPYRMLTLSGIETQLNADGVQRLLDDLRLRKPPADTWAEGFNHAWLHSALDELAIHNPDIKGFVGATHNGYVEDFKHLDADRLKLAKDRVRRIHAERTIAAMNEHPEQEAFIKQEAARSRKFKPLRVVFQEACEVMTAVCPCWMASPLSVAQLIHQDVKFDYVVFDEASQILPEDAIPAIMRARYVIVAGDNKQLPPTGFFASGMDDEESESNAGGFESLLDMMLPFARGFHLNWHYRSRDEALIAFSNHWMYDNKLVTFPGVGGPPAITHSLVNHIPESDGQEDSSSAEVTRVVELVLQHARSKPNKSLGVIAMGIKHAQRVQQALDLAQSKRPELSEFFDPGRVDRFFVKNLERVQGDERDCIILTVGYGKDRGGNLPLRFGPILSAGGMRRLNVAVTRARETMTVVSSFAHTDIDTTKVREGTGLEFLRNYLQYAASDGKIFAHGKITGEAMNDFESDICEALTARGLKVTPQVGCSSFRIDFGVCHPSQPGRFVLAIEADGATYHSSYTARDRDRLRQQMLENLGWTFHRIWSTDWFQHRHEEIERTVAAYERAVLKADERKAQAFPIASVAEYVPELPMEELSGKRASVFPPIPKRSSIGEYTQGELRALYAWVGSDGQLRTHDEIADEMFRALPFSRRGTKIEAALRNTIRRMESVKRR
jgi:very-short-patch-repair endonuclease